MDIVARNEKCVFDVLAVKNTITGVMLVENTAYEMGLPRQKDQKPG